MKLPNSVKEIADVLGEELTLFLIGQLPRCYQGQQYHVIMYVPTVARLKPTHELVRILGWNDAVKLCTVFGGEILHPAPCASLYKPFRDTHIRRLVSEGMAIPLVAEWFNVSERLVKNIHREIPQEERRARGTHTVAAARGCAA